MNIQSWLQYFGITPDQITPFVLFGVVFWFIFIRPNKNVLSKIKNAITEIQTILRGQGHDTQHLVEAPGSPLRPTKYGVKLIKESGLEKILNDKKEELINELKDTLGENYSKYDLQQNARNILLSRMDDPDFKSVKEYAYENGLDAKIILKAGGLWLRDDFLGHKRKIKNN